VVFPRVLGLVQLLGLAQLVAQLDCRGRTLLALHSFRLPVWAWLQRPGCKALTAAVHECERRELALTCMSHAGSSVRPAHECSFSLKTC
jgi:hypothetical protein